MLVLLLIAFVASQIIPQAINPDAAPFWPTPLYIIGILFLVSVMIWVGTRIIRKG